MVIWTYGTSESFTNVIRGLPELATGMDMGIRTPQCFYLSKGRDGVLENVRQSIVRPDTCLFIMVSYQGSCYLGRLNFDDQEFCRHIFELLKANYGRSLIEIGSIDVPNAPGSL